MAKVIFEEADRFGWSSDARLECRSEKSESGLQL